MAYKLRSEKEIKDLRVTQKRTSFSEESQVKEMTEMILKELHRMQEKQDAYQKLAQEQMLDFKKEIKNELKGMKQEIGSISQELKELKSDKAELRKSHEKLQREVHILEGKTNKIETKQELMEMKEMEYQLRLRNIYEESRENIRSVVVEIMANLTQCPIEEIENRIDRVYRINTNYAKRNKTPRDVIVNFTKKIYRDEILKLNNENYVKFKEKKVIILREFPLDTINRRRKYFFLVEELKRHNIRFRKATMRGYFIQQSAQKKRKKQEQLKQILEEITEIENKLKKNPKNNKLLQ
uniref:L1 transposable element RRM domain-containing protein n=1 Tax=Anolis carolinensis TaxID=28377 RepID=A0A803TMG4_ANOCA